MTQQHHKAFAIRRKRPPNGASDTITASYLQDSLPGIHSLQVDIFDLGGRSVPLCQVQIKDCFTVLPIMARKREAIAARPGDIDVTWSAQGIWLADEIRGFASLADAKG